jgi:RNA polymerase sigma-70 factor (ECF subfamily)
MTDFAGLLEEQIPRLRRYALALTRNPDKADDLLQNTLVRAIAKQHLFRPETNLRAWLFTLLHNQHVNDVRRSASHGSAVSIEDAASELVAVADPSASRQLTELDQAIGKLPVEQRQVILMVGLEGMAYDEVAAILMVPIGTVRSRLSRGRSALRQLMGMDEGRPTAGAPDRLAA